MSWIFPTPYTPTPLSRQKSRTVFPGGGTEKSRRSGVRVKWPGVPVNGRAMTLRTLCTPVRMRRATRHHWYRVGSGTTSACAAIWNTESPLVYTMGRPVRRCSSPSCSMISVPDAAVLPSTKRPIASSNGWMTSGGKPFGYKGNGRSRTMPHISQWPVVVSLPAERSVSRPWPVPGPAVGTMPSIRVSRPRPRRSRFGAWIPPTAREQLPSVSEPSSPEAAASGASPTPNESHTSIRTLGTRDVLTDRSPTLAPLLAIDAQDGPRESLQTLDRDGLSAGLAGPVRPELHLGHRPVHVPQVGAQGLHHRKQPGAFRRAVRAVGEPPLHVDLDVVRVGGAAQLYDLLAQVVPVLVQDDPEVGHLRLIDHARSPLATALVRRARGCAVKYTSRRCSLVTRV